MMTSDFDRFVFVALPGRSEYVVAGRFRVSVTRGGVPLGEFVYGRSYLGRPDAVELDPVQLRLSDRVRRTSSINGLFGAIRDTFPIRWGSLMIEKDSVSRRPDEVNQTVPIPTDTVGALCFAPGLEPPSPPRFHTIDNLVRLQSAVHAGIASKHGGRVAAAAPGPEPQAQGRPKAIVEEEHTLWVAKFVQARAPWNQTRVRHATLQLAADCGLDTVPSRVERVRGSDVLLLRRYDREWTGDGYACSRLISGLTFLETDDTPAERDGWSYLALADEVRRVSSHPRADLRELFRRMCFNAAISHLNDDLRHPIMVAKGHGWRLAPASGPAPTPPAEDARGEFAMICGPEGRTPSRKNIVGGAGRFLLGRVEAEAVFDRIAATVRSSWHGVMRGCGVSVRDCQVVGRGVGGN